jgi:hypothetical protein
MRAANMDPRSFKYLMALYRRPTRLGTPPAQMAKKTDSSGTE